MKFTFIWMSWNVVKNASLKHHSETLGLEPSNLCSQTLQKSGHELEFENHCPSAGKYRAPLMPLPISLPRKEVFTPWLYYFPLCLTQSKNISSHYSLKRHYYRISQCILSPRVCLQLFIPSLWNLKLFQQNALHSEIFFLKTCSFFSSGFPLKMNQKGLRG